MAVKGRIEFVVLGEGGPRQPQIVDRVIGSATNFNTIAAVNIDRPAYNGLLHVRVTATTGKAVFAVGVNATATNSNGLVVPEGRSEVQPIFEGERVSVIGYVEV